MRILFEDSSVLVAIKPSGILSQEDCGGKTNMVELLKEHTKGVIFPLHRLDREVSGVMVFAKDNVSAAILSRDIAEHRFNKEYLCIAKGRPEPLKGEMLDLLFKDSKKNKSFVVSRVRRGVKEARLSYEFVSEGEVNGLNYSLIRVKLHTGRTHQIRVQFSHRKMPLLGDKKYGGDSANGFFGLFSHKISFPHPKTKEQLSFEATPDDEIFNLFIN